MPYPPPVPPDTRTNATVSADNHPADHNAISVALTEIINHIAALEQTLAPIGQIIMWPSNTMPGGYLKCDGQSVPKVDYPELFAVIGSTFGGDATNFNVPDYRGRIPCGVNQAGQPLSGGVNERFGSYDGQLIYHAHAGVNHLHALGSGLVRMNWGEVYQQWSTEADNVDSFRILLGGPGDPYSSVIHKFPSSSYPSGLEGMTAGADRDLSTDYRGVAATNTNIPPVLTLHFAIRAR
jgi:Microcystin-dependent protein